MSAFDLCSVESFTRRLKPPTSGSSGGRQRISSRPSWVAFQPFGAS